MLDVDVFGSLRLRSGDTVLDSGSFTGRKPRQLLQILVARRGRIVPKDQLADLLWGAEPPVNLAASLEHYVSVLRRQLQPGVPLRETVLATESGGYRLVTDRIRVDLDRFDTLLAEADSASAPTRRRLLREAVGLARGEVFEDEPYATWAQEERDHYRPRLIHVLVGAAQLALQAGDAFEAQTLAERILRLDPYAESGYRHAMLAAYALGRQEEALRWYARCREALIGELGVEPLAETALLHQAILQHRPLGELLGERVEGATAAGPAGVLPLLGRREELDLLAAEGERARQDGCRLVLLVGEHGVGKSRLLAEFRARLSGAVGSVACQPADVGLSHGTLLMCLRSVTADTGDQAAAALLAELSRGELTPVSRVALYEEVAAILRAHAPLVQLLDDAQFADPDTLAALGYAQRTGGRAGGRPVPNLIVLAVRPDQLGPDHPIHQLRPDAVIELAPLTAADIAPLGGGDLFARTGGLPALLADMGPTVPAQRPGRNRTGPPPGPSVTRTMTGFVRDRCAQLDRHQRRLLAVASALPQPFDPKVLAGLLGTDVLDLLEALDDLVANRMLHPAGERFAFVYGRVGEALRESLSPARRQAITARAAAPPISRARIDLRAPGRRPAQAVPVGASA